MPAKIPAESENPSPSTWSRCRTSSRPAPPSDPGPDHRGLRPRTVRIPRRIRAGEAHPQGCGRDRRQRAVASMESRFDRRRPVHHHGRAKSRWIPLWTRPSSPDGSSGGRRETGFGLVVPVALRTSDAPPRVTDRTTPISHDRPTAPTTVLAASPRLLPRGLLGRAPGAVRGTDRTRPRAPTQADRPTTLRRDRRRPVVRRRDREAGHRLQTLRGPDRAVLLRRDRPARAARSSITTRMGTSTCTSPRDASSSRASRSRTPSPTIRPPRSARAIVCTATTSSRTA